MITRDEKWMATCIFNAHQWSTCSKRQYFALIVDEFGNIVGSGYNGGPSGMPHCNEGHCPRAQMNSASGSNYDNCISIHAEANCIMRTQLGLSRRNSTLYVNGSPCFACAKLIVNSGVRRVVYLHDESYAQEEFVLDFLQKAGITLMDLSESEYCLCLRSNVTGLFSSKENHKSIQLQPNL